MPWVTPTNFVAGQVVTEANLDNLSDILTSGVVRPIAETILAAPAATVDFLSIPATFRNLMLTYNARGSTAAASIEVFLRMNNETTATLYHSQAAFFASSGTNYLEYAGSLSGILIGAIPGASAAQADEFGAASIDILDYQNPTSLKTLVGVASERYGGAGAASQRTYIVGGTWDNVAVLNRLTVFPATGNFTTGSKFTLLGVPYT